MAKAERLEGGFLRLRAKDMRQVREQLEAAEKRTADLGAKLDTADKFLRGDKSQ